jgi:hypothetical protein
MFRVRGANHKVSSRRSIHSEGTDGEVLDGSISLRNARIVHPNEHIFQAFIPAILLGQLSKSIYHAGELMIFGVGVFEAGPLVGEKDYMLSGLNECIPVLLDNKICWLF